MPEDFAKLQYFKDNSFFKDQGFAKVSRFRLEVVPNTPLMSGVDFSPLVNNLISAGLPNKGLQDQSTPFSHIITRKQEPGNISLKFWESNTLEIKTFMQEWMKLYMDDHKGQSEWFENRVTNFFDDISVTIMVHHLPYGNDANKRTDYFYKVFPVTLGNINYHVGNENQLAEIDVTFKYLFHSINLDRRLA